MLDAEKNVMRAAYGFRRAGTLDSLWLAVRGLVDPTRDAWTMSFDVTYLPNGDSFKIRTCPIVRHVTSAQLIDIIKSRNGDFWYAVERS